ncbi:Structure-specific endonuclease subunit slx1 [Lachnellula hyalina]|uniref:Structure-specific endonuclease subunit slx1 n=1 Tax=Lachnellula hyalina TaxID=1316788 RepID=A0A8H8R3Q2_9HELO|nr:Structure-specific endonuclease subunit slx1 [Lachnellula hyalina]TVY26925.1 Structure-specific endonuclease subunit slx1 [Lachnellula hyalina]
MPMDRPIPAFYCCYLLRSTVRHGSVYVGSTPNPVRRLKQHNGLAKGGAVRTSKKTLRPWEMTCIVTGFPSHIAALQFEWAWQNPHITLHIAPEERLQRATQKKRSGQPKRPRHSVPSLLSNLHVLLRSPSFSRWPLELRFFSADVHKAWTKWTKVTAESIRDSLPVIQDFSPVDQVSSGDESGSSPKNKKRKTTHGIAALPIDYTNQKTHVVIGKEIVEFEREGSCKICKRNLEHDAGIYTICPSPGCESVTHLTCLSKHFLRGDEETLVPIKGHCPSCNTELRWVDVVKELSLRMRGQKEVEKLLKVKRARKTKGSASQVAVESSDGEDDEDEIMEEFVPGTQGMVADYWRAIDDTDGSDAESITSNISLAKTTSLHASKPGALGTVIEDSDWDDMDVLD